MSLVKWEKQETVAVLTMDNGPNRMTLDYAQQMLAALDEAEADKGVKSLVITGSDGKNWSQGIDLEWLMTQVGGGRLDVAKQFIYAMNDLFARLLLFPCPVIAALDGHAFGDGALLACCCDFRFMRADHGFFCFPEVDINIPFLPGMVAFSKKAIPQPLLTEMTLTGRRYTAPELEARGAITKACADREELMSQVMAWAAPLQKGRAIVAELKKRAHKEIIAVLKEQDPPLIENLALQVHD